MVRGDYHSRSESYSVESSSVDSGYDFNNITKDATEAATGLASEFSRSLMNIANDVSSVFETFGLPACEVPLQNGRRRNLDGDDEVALDWRGSDPTKNFSDWTLVIYDGQRRDSYHVHKYMLINGDRRSEYFVRMFDESQRDSSDGARQIPNNTGEVYLPTIAAEMVPQWLDYTYRNELSFCTMNAVGLRCIANTLDVRELYREASSFIRKDLNVKTAPVYCDKGNMVKDKELVGKAIKVCVQNFTDLDVTIISPHIMNKIVSHERLTCPSEQLSEQVARHIRAKKLQMTDELFYFMTLGQVIPRISPHEAIWFLNYAAVNYPQFLKNEDMEGSTVNGKSLRRRCVEACSIEWMTVGKPLSMRRESYHSGASNSKKKRNSKKERNDLTLYEGLPTDVKVQILEASLIAAMDSRECTSSRSERISKSEQRDNNY